MTAETELIEALVLPFVYMFIGLLLGYVIGSRTGILDSWSDLWYAFFPRQKVVMTDGERAFEIRRVNNIGYGILCFALALICFILAIYYRYLGVCII